MTGPTSHLPGNVAGRMQEFSLRYLGETLPAGWECAAPGWKFREGGGTPVILLDGEKDAWVLMEQLEFLNGSLKEKEWKDSVVFLLGEEQGAIQEKTQMLKDNLLQKYRMVPAMYGAADRNAFRTILCRHLADTVLAEKISENIRRITERITSLPGWEMDVDLVDIYRELEALQEI